MPFFKGYRGKNEAVIDIKIFEEWLRDLIEGEIITEQELKEAEEAWQDYIDGKYKTLDEIEKELL